MWNILLQDLINQGASQKGDPKGYNSGEKPCVET